MSPIKTGLTTYLHSTYIDFRRVVLIQHRSQISQESPLRGKLLLKLPLARTKGSPEVPLSLTLRRVQLHGKEGFVQSPFQVRDRFTPCYHRNSS